MGDAMLEGNEISIHAPLRERRYVLAYFRFSWHFNPRSLAGATIPPIPMLCAICYFNPRSLAGATKSQKPTTSNKKISIHAPLRERLLCMNIVDKF